MKKGLISIFIFIFIFLFPIIYANVEYEQLVTSDGTKVTYRGKNEPVMIPTTYQTPERQFRGVWVTQLAGDVRPYSTKESFKSELLSVLDTMEKYRLNTIIYHIRIMNDALYKTDLSPISNFVQGIDFDEWDYLEWFINEAHSRGIEFHAWLNPYRIQNSSEDPQLIANRYKDYPLNPASDPDNILVGNSGAILNPGEPKVREFIIDVCMDVIRNYDVDAIHFDDYFYIDMNPNADLETYNKYKHNSETTNIEDWRREQVDILISDLSAEMRLFNKTYNRQVQLGISPSGIWRNGDGVIEGYDENGNAITNGANTERGFAHYGNYLYSNTKKWIDEEWIDYIIPQTYWGFTNKIAPYADVTDWWPAVVKYKDVNLYTGMGLYRAGDSGTDSWGTDQYEAANQVLYNSKFTDIDGVAIYSYKHLNSSYTQPALNKILEEYWTEPALNPVVKTSPEVVPSDVRDVNIVKTMEGFTLSWEPVHNARKYAIYRSVGNVDINDPKQLVGVVGENSEFGVVIFNDSVETNINYNYAVVSVSGTNTKGNGFVISTSNLDENVNFPIASFDEIYFTGTLFPNGNYQVRFNEALVYAGSPLQYTLYFSYDKINWIEVKDELRKAGYTYSFFDTYPSTGRPFYFKVIGENELGKIESDIIKAVPKVYDISTYFDFVFIVIRDKITKVIPSGS